MIRTGLRWAKHHMVSLLRRATGGRFPLEPQYKEFIDRVELVRTLQQQGGHDEESRAQQLRKAAHIIDKGLQRDDWEPGHSTKWYRVAKELDGQIESAVLVADPSIRWARRKITEYEVGQETKSVSRQHFTVDAGCDYEQLLQTIRARRSVRFYREQPVSEETIEKIASVVTWASNSCNKQTAKVFVANSPDLVKACLGTCKGATCFSDYVPTFLCFCSDMRSYWLPQEMLLPNIDVSLGIQNCALVAHSLGLSMTLLTWAQHTAEDDARLRSLLGIPEYYRIIVNGALGYPEYYPDPPLRKDPKTTYVLVR